MLVLRLSRYFSGQFHRRTDQPGPRRAEGFLGGVADPLGDVHAVAQQRPVGIGPLVHFLPWHDQRVAGVEVSPSRPAVVRERENRPSLPRSPLLRSRRAGKYGNTEQTTPARSVMPGASDLGFGAGSRAVAYSLWSP